MILVPAKCGCFQPFAYIFAMDVNIHDKCFTDKTSFGVCEFHNKLFQSFAQNGQNKTFKGYIYSKIPFCQANGIPLTQLKRWSLVVDN